MREDGSEFDKDLSQIIQLGDINGDLHMHTTYSDGTFSIKEMIEANIAKGYEFMVITDHSQSLKSSSWITSRPSAKTKCGLRLPCVKTVVSLIKI